MSEKGKQGEPSMLAKYIAKLEKKEAKENELKRKIDDTNDEIRSLGLRIKAKKAEQSQLWETYLNSSADRRLNKQVQYHLAPGQYNKNQRILSPSPFLMEQMFRELLKRLHKEDIRKLLLTSRVFFDAMVKTSNGFFKFSTCGESRIEAFLVKPRLLMLPPINEFELTLFNGDEAVLLNVLLPLKDTLEVVKIFGDVKCKENPDFATPFGRFTELTNVTTLQIYLTKQQITGLPFQENRQLKSVKNLFLEFSFASKNSIANIVQYSPQLETIIWPLKSCKKFMTHASRYMKLEEIEQTSCKRFDLIKYKVTRHIN